MRWLQVVGAVAEAHEQTGLFGVYRYGCVTFLPRARSATNAMRREAMGFTLSRMAFEGLGALTCSLCADFWVHADGGEGRLVDDQHDVDCNREGATAIGELQTHARTCSPFNATANTPHQTVARQIDTRSPLESMLSRK